MTDAIMGFELFHRYKALFGGELHFLIYGKQSPAAFQYKSVDILTFRRFVR